MKICVDTVVLIDVLKDEFVSGQEKLYSAIVAKETLIATPVVYAELMPQFSGITSFLKEHHVRIDRFLKIYFWLSSEKPKKETSEKSC